MKNKPLVSVIIASHNAEQYIDDCLESLVNQTYANIEIIICDDASTDNSISLLKSWENKDSRIKVIRNKENLFAAASRNNCFDVAKGDYYMIQDVDDLSTHDRVEKLLNAFEGEDVDFISSAAKCFDKDPSVFYDVISHKSYPQKRDFLWGISFMHPASIFKKECIKAVGGYRVSKETRRCQDYDMFMRLYAAGFKGKNIPDELYLYRLDRDNIKRRTMDSEIGEFYIRKRNYKILHLNPLGYIFMFKPFISHYYSLIKYRFLSK